MKKILLFLLLIPSIASKHYIIMKNIITILFILLITNAYSQISVLNEGGKKLSGTSADQILSWNGTSWVPSTPNSQLVIGPFQTTASTTGLSIISGELRQHPADYNNAGAVSLTDQFLGKGKKTISNEGNTLTKAFVLYNALAADGDDGEGVSMDFLGGGETPMVTLSGKQNDVTGSTFSVNVRNATGQVEMVKYNGEGRTTTHEGIQTIATNQVVSGIHDATLDGNKKSSYNKNLIY